MIGLCSSKGENLEILLHSENLDISKPYKVMHNTLLKKTKSISSFRNFNDKTMPFFSSILTCLTRDGIPDASGFHTTFFTPIKILILL